MKKNLLYLFALICSVSLFTACSDDDDNSWQELPKGEIKAENVDFQLNGASTTGTVNFEATSLQSATVGFKNVIDGYSDVTVDVAMEKQADGSFKFNGTKDIMTKPVTRETAKPTPLLKVTVDGTITPEGKVALNVSATGAGLILPQVLQSVTLEADGNISAKYSSGSITFEPSWAMGLIFGGGAPGVDVLNKLIPTDGWQQSPKNLAYWFPKDDKLYLKLNVPAIISQAMGSNAESLAPIISEILNGDAATVKKLIGTMLKVDMSSISDETFEMLLSWVNNGVPLNVKNTDKGHTYIYLDKTAFDPIMVDKEMSADSSEFGTGSDLFKLWKIMMDAKIIPEDAAAAIILLIGLPQNWPSTTGFDLGLDLLAK